MSDVRFVDVGETPTLTVRVYRDGVLLHSELCESEADAAAAVETWEQEANITCEVGHLSAERHDVEDLELEPTEIEDYPPVG